jgi:hypothetical protein
VAEVEVESVAYIVCDALGLETGDYSFPYVTRWAEGSSELIKETAERAIGCARKILRCLQLPGDRETRAKGASYVGSFMRVARRPSRTSSISTCTSSRDTKTTRS